MQLRRAIGALLAGAALAMTPAAALAQNPAAEARAAFQEGVQHFGERHFAEALVSFQRAYRVRAHPSVMVNIANCYLALEQPLEAISWFERYLHDAQVTPEQRAEIARTIAEARQRLATLTILAQPPGAEVYLDGTSIGVAPLRGSREVAAGPHVLEARNPNGGAVQYQARVEPGRALTITLNTLTREAHIGSVPPGANDAALAALATPPPAPSPAPPPFVAPTAPVAVPPPRAALRPPPPDTSGPRVLPPRDETPTRRRSGFVPAVVTGSLVTVAGVAVAISVAVYNEQWIAEYNTLALNFEYYRDRDVDRAREYQAQGREHRQVIEQNQTLVTVSAVVGGIGAAFTLGTLIFWPREPVSSRRGGSLTWRVTPTPGGVVIGGTF